MKRSLIFLSVLVLGAVSCTDLNEMHQPYLDRGETIYTEKPDSLTSMNGRERVKLNWYLYSDAAITGARIYWNDEQDSTDVAYSVTAGMTNSISAMVEGLEEGSYIFNVKTMDQYGNMSVPVQVAGVSYGDEYANSLVNNRAIASNQTENDTIVFTMKSIKYDDYIDSELKFTDNSGNEQSTLLTDEDKTKFEISRADIDIAQPIYYRSLYRPLNSIDIFYTEYKLYEEDIN